MNEPIGPGGGAGTLPRLGDLVADALRYWEPRRILYNLTLGLVVIAHFA